MARSSEVEQAVAEARRLLADNGYDCATTAEDLRRWFEADSPFDENFGLDEVIRIPLLVAHELVEIEKVKEMGLALTKDVITRNLETVDDAHLIATEVELRLAVSAKNTDHLRDRLENIRMWIEDESVTSENKKKYSIMYAETLRALEDLS